MVPPLQLNRSTAGLHLTRASRLDAQTLVATGAPRRERPCVVLEFHRRESQESFQQWRSCGASCRQDATFVLRQAAIAMRRGGQQCYAESTNGCTISGGRSSVLIRGLPRVAV